MSPVLKKMFKKNQVNDKLKQLTNKILVVEDRAPNNRAFTAEQFQFKSYHILSFLLNILGALVIEMKGGGHLFQGDSFFHFGEQPELNLEND